MLETYSKTQSIKQSAMSTTPIDVEIGLPSIRNLSNWIKDAKAVEVKLLTNDLLEGRLRWQDTNCVCLLDSQDETILIWRHAIAYIRPKS
jgi:host factor-I protein